jgi:hypothetical protein
MTMAELTHAAITKEQGPSPLVNTFDRISASEAMIYSQPVTIMFDKYV